jgi:DNA-binding MarR family transcriptional regulator
MEVSMEDIRSVLSQFHTKKKRQDDVRKSGIKPQAQASSSEIPDVFFDEILRKYKLKRSEITLLMYLYRQVWCRPNLYRAHGIGPLNSYADLALILNVSHEELAQLIRALEGYGFIETVRAGQYFVRKYFTDALDSHYGQNYDEFF